MSKFSSPPAGPPLAAGLESDFCRCWLEVLHVFQNFTQRVWLDRGSDQANRSELAAGREDHATTPINRAWTNVRRGLGRAGTCPEPRCITSTISSADCRRTATSTSAAAAVRRARCAQLSRHHLAASAWYSELPCFADCRAVSRAAAQLPVRRLTRPSLWGWCRN